MLNPLICIVLLTDSEVHTAGPRQQHLTMCKPARTMPPLLVPLAGAATGCVAGLALGAANQLDNHTTGRNNNSAPTVKAVVIDAPAACPRTRQGRRNGGGPVLNACAHRVCCLRSRPARRR